MVRKAGVLGLTTVLLLSAACGGDDPSGAADAPTTIIYRGNGGEPGSLDPALAEDVHAFNILADLYEGLVGLSADGALIPGAAESWSISEDGLSYTFTLRASGRWSNGDPVTARNFVDAFRRVTARSSMSPYATLLEPVADMVAVDASTLQISLREPAPHILSILSMPVSYPAASTEPAASPESMLSNGAYVVTERTPGGEIRLRRNPEYWDAAAVAVDEIVYLPIVDPLAELNMFRAGELHITNTIAPGHFRSLREDMPDSVRVSPALALYYLAFDLTEPPFDDARLRQALNMAIDRRQLVEITGRGEQPAYGIVPEGVNNYAPARFEWASLPDATRIRQARDLYRQAGFGADSPLTLKYTYDAGDIHETVALAIAGMWRDTLGVDVSLEKKEWQYFLDTRDQRSDWEVMRFAWFGDYNDATTFTNIFRSDDAQNLPRYSNADYDRLVATEPNGNAAEALLLGEHPVAPLYFYVSKHLVDPRIGGFEDNVLDRHPSKYLYLKKQ